MALTIFDRAGGAPSLRFIGGDSVGANLAVGLMLSLRNAGAPLPDAALLFYGAYAADEETLSHRTFGDGSYGLLQQPHGMVPEALSRGFASASCGHPSPCGSAARGSSRFASSLCCRRSAMFCAPKANYLHNERKKLVSRSMI
jgi:acetyl esterase/lipase